MTDTMLFGVLKMPFEMAMKDEISRIQYYARVQELVGRFEAQQQAEPVPRWDVDEDNPDSLAKHPAFRATPKQQAEPVEEHITHITWDERGVRTVNGIPDDAPQQQQAEPVACKSCQDIGGNWAWKCNLCGEVDESREPEPPQRQWVGLTEDDIAQAMCRADAIFTGPMQFKFAKELEAKLKERNT